MPFTAQNGKLRDICRGIAVLFQLSDWHLMRRTIKNMGIRKKKKIGQSRNSRYVCFNLTNMALGDKCVLEMKATGFPANFFLLIFTRVSPING